MYILNKYHRTDAGEVATGTGYRTKKDALSAYYGLCKAYTDDDTVQEWSVSIVEASPRQTMIMRAEDTKVVPVPEHEADIVEEE